MNEINQNTVARAPEHRSSSHVIVVDMSLQEPRAALVVFQ